MWRGQHRPFRAVGRSVIGSWRSYLLDTCPDYAGAHLVEGLFEREMDLRTRGRPSQTDLPAFVKLASSSPTAPA